MKTMNTKHSAASLRGKGSERRYVGVRWVLAFFAVSMLLASCREDEVVSYVTEQDTGGSTSTSTIRGLYVLCEGNMGSNKCTLDFLDLTPGNGQQTSRYLRNIYGDRNPGTVKELGDVGNDIGCYGSKLWMVINCSNKVEVCDARTTRRLGQVNIPNARYLAFADGFAYVSSYAGPVVLDENAPLGRVYKVDTLTLAKLDSLTVGYQPEEMAVSQGRLYVANSGGYRPPQYDDRVTVIDLANWRVTDEIHVAPNLHRLAADRYGQLWVSSRGDYYGEPSALHCVTADGRVEHLERAVSVMALAGDSLFCLGSEFSYLTGASRHEAFLVDVKRRAILETSLFDAPELTGVTLPYGLVVNPQERDFYVMDAKNYVSSGELLHFKADGQFDWRVSTGDIPSRGTFVY